MANGTTTANRPLLGQDQLQALQYLLGRGAAGIMAKWPESWQSQFGNLGAEMAKSQQYAQLIKDVLGGGGKITADGEKTTLHIPTPAQPDAGPMSGRSDMENQSFTKTYPAATQGGIGNFLRALFSNYSQTQE